MERRKGTFIVIEGTDGSGKGTQFELLCDRLRQAGYDIATFDFPQYNADSSYFVKQYLNGTYGNTNEVGPYTASLFYALDRYEAAPKIRQALEAGKVVISNRFTGSSMGHQGTKFKSPEERRGYFIWLDNLEFEMLRIPRPDISFVLRVPADIAQGLVDQKAVRSYTDKKRDIHEADLTHLEKAVEVYDDLAQLFPKDFQRVDCVRGDKLLGIETIQNMLWEKIAPLLPPPPQLEMRLKSDPSTTESPAATAPSPAVSETLPASETSQPSKFTCTLENASQLLLQRLQHTWFAAYSEEPDEYQRYDQKQSGAYRYYVPPEFDADTASLYRTHLDHIFDLYAEMLSTLTVHLAASSLVPRVQRDDAWKYAIQSKAWDAVQSVLPAATTASVAVPGQGAKLQELVVRLLTDDLPEARLSGEQLLGEIHAKTPHMLDTPDFAERTRNTITYRATTFAGMSKLTKSQLPESYGTETTPLRLLGATPRNELDLVPDMLYEHSNLPLASLRAETDHWPYNRKLDVLDAYIGNRTSRSQRPGTALDNAHYVWDIVSDFRVLRDLQRHRLGGDVTWQLLSPRLGYDMPELIEEAGLTDHFEDCFDTSLKLYSLLQQAGYAREAQYAALLGHKVRWSLRHSARDAFTLYEQPGLKPSTYTLLATMHQLMNERHPLLADSVQFARGTNQKTAARPHKTNH